MTSRESKSSSRRMAAQVFWKNEPPKEAKELLQQYKAKHKKTESEFKTCEENSLPYSRNQYVSKESTRYIPLNSDKPVKLAIPRSSTAPADISASMFSEFKERQIASPLVPTGRLVQSAVGNSYNVDSKFKKQRTSRRKEIQNSRKAPESLSQPNFENSLGIVIETNDRSEHSPDSLGEELDFSQIHTSLPRISPDPLPSADISFNTDRPGHGQIPKIKLSSYFFNSEISISPNSSTESDPDIVLNSLLKSIKGFQGDTPKSTKVQQIEPQKTESLRKWHMKSFETLIPGGRQDAINLSNWLDETKKNILSKSRAISLIHRTEDDPSSLLDNKEVHAVYAATLHEAIRQVSVHCLERGHVLTRVWNWFFRSFDSMLSKVLREQEYATKDLEQQKMTLQEKERKIDKEIQLLQDQLEVYRARLELVTGEEATNDQLQSGFESRKAKKLEAIRSSGVSKDLEDLYQSMLIRSGISQGNHKENSKKRRADKKKEERLEEERRLEALAREEKKRREQEEEQKEKERKEKELKDRDDSKIEAGVQACVSMKSSESQTNLKLDSLAEIMSKSKAYEVGKKELDETLDAMKELEETIILIVENIRGTSREFREAIPILDAGFDFEPSVLEKASHLTTRIANSHEALHISFEQWKTKHEGEQQLLTELRENNEELEIKLKKTSNKIEELHTEVEKLESQVVAGKNTSTMDVGVQCEIESPPEICAVLSDDSQPKPQSKKKKSKKSKKSKPKQDDSGTDSKLIDADKQEENKTIDEYWFVPKTLRFLYPLKKVPKLPENLVVKTMLTIYKDKMVADAIDDRENNERQTLAEFIHDWHFNNYGLKKIATQHLNRFLYSLQCYRQLPHIRMFERFLGVIKGEKLHLQDLNIYLAAFFFIQNSKLNQPESNPRPDSRLNRNDNKITWLSALCAFECARVVYGGQDDEQVASTVPEKVENFWDDLEHLLSHSGRFSSNRVLQLYLDRLNEESAPYTERYTRLLDCEIDRDLFLMEMVKRRAEMNREAIDFFNSLFDAGDINGDAALNFDEFESMLETALSDHKLSRKDKMALYEDSVDPEIDLVTREAFINMALKRKIFSFVSDRLIGGLSRKDGDLNNVSPSDLFDLLERAWETQRPSIMEQMNDLRGTSYSEELEFRINSLEKSISQYHAATKRAEELGEEGKASETLLLEVSGARTAWLELRMLLTELRRCNAKIHLLRVVVARRAASHMIRVLRSKRPQNS